MKILLLGPYPPPYGGVERYCEYVHKSFLSNKYELDLFRTDIPINFRPSSLTEKYTWNIIKRDGFRSTIKILLIVFKYFIELNKLLSQNKYDKIHVFSTAGYGFFRNTIHIIIAKRKGVFSIFHHLGQIDDLYKNSNSIIKIIIRFCLNLADFHILQSPNLANFLSEITNKPVIYIYNGIDIVQDDYSLKGKNDNIFRIVSLGTLGHKKGTFDLIDVAEKVKKKYKNFQFILIGGGEYNKILDLVKKKGLDDIVKITGPLPEKEKQFFLKSSDLFVLPSYAEGLPLSLLEAMQFGLPIISSKVGAIPEVINENNGFTINPGDQIKLMENIEELFHNKDKRNKISCYNKIEAKNKYSIERVIEQIDEVYSNRFK